MKKSIVEYCQKGIYCLSSKFCGNASKVLSVRFGNLFLKVGGHAGAIGTGIRTRTIGRGTVNFFIGEDLGLDIAQGDETHSMVGGE